MIALLITLYCLVGAFISWTLLWMATHKPKSGTYKGMPSVFQWVFIVAAFFLWGPVTVAVLLYTFVGTICSLTKSKMEDYDE